MASPRCSSSRSASATPRTLFAFALGGLLVGAAWNQLDAYDGRQEAHRLPGGEGRQADGATLSRQQTKALKAWPELVGHMKPSARKIQDKLEAMRGRTPPSSRFRRRSWRNESWLQYRYFFDIFALMLIGMALFKLGLLQPRSSARRVRLDGRGRLRHRPDGELLRGAPPADTSSHALARLQAEVSYDLGRLAMTTGHLGLLMLFCNVGILGWLQRRLAAVGQMALTNYVTHSIVAAMLVSGFGFGLYGHLSRHQLYYVVFAIWAVQLVISPIWLAHFRFGPVEWLWRSLTYGQRQPMRRVAGADDGDPLVAPAG